MNGRTLHPLGWLLITLLLVGPLHGGTARAAVPARVARAQQQQGPQLRKLARRAGVPYPLQRVLIRVFKNEATLELWASTSDRRTYRLLDSYLICAASGKLGPKRRQGDLQVPEGFYHVSVYNPWSSYHLALGINYPNRSDRVRGYKPDLGGAIMIHGDCVSIGCMAMRNGPASQLYLAARQAQRHGQRRVPVHIFPARLSPRGMARLARQYARQPKLLAFWSELQPGFAAFERHRTLPRIRIDRRGRYRITPVPANPAAAPAREARRPGPAAVLVGGR